MIEAVESLEKAYNVQPKKNPFLLTDGGNAERLKEKHGEDLRYCKQTNTWIVWDGKRWTPDMDGEVHRRAKDTVRAIPQEAEHGADFQSTMKWASKSDNAPQLKNMVDLARWILPVRLNALDSNTFLLNFPNGTLDLRTGELREQRREDFITKITAANYEPKADLYDWTGFIGDVTNADQDYADFLQEAAGIGLIGKSYENLFFVYGPPLTGKTTFLEAIAGALGDYAKTLNFEALLEKGRGGGGAANPDLVRLRGSRFVKSVEVSSGRKLAVALLKQLAGGDTVSARELYQKGTDVEEERISYSLYLAANDKPKAPGDDPAFWRRMLLLPFTHSFANKNDPLVKEQLTDPQKSGALILAWMVEGAMRFINRGKQFDEDLPAVVTDATSEWEKESHPLAEFIEEKCVEGDGCTAPAGTLYDEYKDWADENKRHSPMTGTAFGKAMSKSFDKKKTEKGFVYLRIGLVRHEP